MMRPSIDRIQYFNECIRILQITPSRRNEYDISTLLEFVDHLNFFRTLAEQSLDIVRKCVQVLHLRTIRANEVLANHIEWCFLRSETMVPSSTLS